MTTALRTLWWRHVRRYRFEICDDCGRPVGHSTGAWWHSDLWPAVTGADDGVLCPRCFTARAEAAGLPVRWMAVLDG